MTGVLIADDHAFFRSGLEAALVSAGYTVVASVDDGDAVPAAIAEHDPDVVILDLRMPRVDGVTAVRQMRARGDKRPVIILAAEIGDQALLDLMAEQADAIIYKNGAESRLFSALGAVKEGVRYIDSELMDRAFSKSGSPRSASWSDPLNPRETAITELVAKGMRNREIAEALGMTESTVKIYLHGVFGKLGVKSRTELASLVHRSAQPVN